MPGPGGPVNDLIRMLLDEAGHSFGARPSASLRNRMQTITHGKSYADPNANVVPGPGANPPISKDPWFDEITGAGGNELFVFVTNPRGKRIRVAGPFPDQSAAQSALDRLAKNSKGVTLDIGPWTPQPE